LRERLGAVDKWESRLQELEYLLGAEAAAKANRNAGV
jgi:hypothetical protein